MTIRATITTIDKKREAQREVQQRQRVYRRLVENGKMKQADADRQIAIMQAIADDYTAKAIEEDKATRLL